MENGGKGLNPSSHRPRVVVGITGASGFCYGVAALCQLRALDVETHLVLTDAADLTRVHETSMSRQEVEALADVVHPAHSVGAAIASGSFRTLGMIVAPCSMHSLAAVAQGMSENLLLRAADVALKERRPLVLMVREAPLHLGHLRNMVAATEVGAIIFPPVPAMYAHPASLDAVVTQSAARAISLLGLEPLDLPRWGESLVPPEGGEG